MEIFLRENVNAVIRVGNENSKMLALGYQDNHKSSPIRFLCN